LNVTRADQPSGPIGLPPVQLAALDELEIVVETHIVVECEFATGLGKKLVRNDTLAAPFVPCVFCPQAGTSVDALTRRQCEFVVLQQSLRRTAREDILKVHGQHRLF
jgi:hypothetical protein